MYLTAGGKKKDEYPNCVQIKFIIGRKKFR